MTGFLTDMHAMWSMLHTLHNVEDLHKLLQWLSLIWTMRQHSFAMRNCTPTSKNHPNLL